MSQNSGQYRVYLSASECQNLHVYFDLQWELVVFLFNTVSAAVGYIAIKNWKLKYQVSIFVN